jgi:uncharacterized protein (TIGR02284 family)
MSHDDIVDTLNDLIETSKDGEFGFTACAKHVKSTDLRDLFLRRAEDCRAAAAELQTLVVEYGGKPDSGWVAVRGSLAGYSDHAMLEECERGEDAALARYRAALRNEELPESVRAVIARQQLGVQQNHDQVKRMRDIDKAA